jgi:hypothetical protein
VLSGQTNTRTACRRTWTRLGVDWSSTVRPLTARRFAILLRCGPATASMPRRSPACGSPLCSAGDGESAARPQTHTLCATAVRPSHCSGVRAARADTQSARSKPPSPNSPPGNRPLPRPWDNQNFQRPPLRVRIPHNPIDPHRQRTPERFIWMTFDTHQLDLSSDVPRRYSPIDRAGLCFHALGTQPDANVTPERSQGRQKPAIEQSFRP